MKNFIQPGKTVTVTAPADVVSGQVLKIGALLGVVVASAKSGESCELELEGVFEVTKKTSDNIVVGSLLYWDPTPGEMTITKAATNVVAGAALALAGNTATTVVMRLNGTAVADEV